MSDLMESVVNEVWTTEVLTHGLLWPAPVKLWFNWMVTQDAYFATLYNEGVLYSFRRIEPPRLASSLRFATYIDSEIQSLQQHHFFAQAAQRGGYY